MYWALWSRLPGPVWVRMSIALALIAVVVVVLFGWVFPALDPVVFPADEVVAPTR